MSTGCSKIECIGNIVSSIVSSMSKNTNKTKKNQLGINDFCENSIRQATPNQSLKRNNSVRNPQESDQPHKKPEIENKEQPTVVITNTMI